jgi:hypothetical protein
VLNVFTKPEIHETKIPAFVKLYVIDNGRKIILPTNALSINFFDITSRLKRVTPRLGLPQPSHTTQQDEGPKSSRA